MGFEINELQQRLKRKGKWPKWLPAPFLLKITFRIGVLSYRLWDALLGGPDS